MMMNFFEPGKEPKPREEVKIELLETSLYADRWRVRIIVHVTSFRERPSLLIALLRHGGEEPQVIAELSIIETMHPKMEFTLHVRGVDDPAGDYTLITRLYYEEISKIYDEREITLHIPEEGVSFEPQQETISDASDE